MSPPPNRREQAGVTGACRGPASRPSRWSPTSDNRRAAWRTTTGCSVVFDCATPDHRRVRVRGPFRRLLAKSREPSVYVISPRSLIDAAEPA